MRRPEPNLRIDPATVPGWGVDADPANDPTAPMRERSAQNDHGLTWARPPLQPRDVEVLVSVEHQRFPAVFGDSSPPRGLSGALRRKAFGFSESQWAHWLLLMLADRVNVVEGLGADLGRGRAPDLLAEWGLTRPGGVSGRVATAGSLALVAMVAMGAAAAVSRGRRSRRLHLS